MGKKSKRPGKDKQSDLNSAQANTPSFPTHATKNMAAKASASQKLKTSPPLLAFKLLLMLFVASSMAQACSGLPFLVLAAHLGGTGTKGSQGPGQG